MTTTTRCGVLMMGYRCFAASSLRAALVLVVSLLSVEAFGSAPASRLPLMITNKVAHDFNLDLNNRPYPNITLTDRNVAVYAWNTFFALNSPALPVDSEHRGTPNPKLPFGAPAPAVWNTFKEKRELFRVVADTDIADDFTYVSKSGFAYAVSDPGSFDALTPYDAMSPGIGPCPGVEPVSPSEVWNYLDESQEIGLATIWLGGDRPDNDSLVRTQVKMNRAYYDYVRDNGFYATATLNAAIAAKTSPGPNQLGPVHLPLGSPSNEGAILVKTSWVKASRLPDALRGDFYTERGLYYDTVVGEAKSSEPQGASSVAASAAEPQASAAAAKSVKAPAGAGGVCYRVDDFALIGIHYIHKTVSFPHFLYTSFQNVHNKDLPFVYANSLGKASTLPNAFGEPYKNPPDPQPGLQDPPYLAHFDLNPPRPVVQDVNAEALALMRQRFPQAVWQHYALVGLQFAPANGPQDAINLFQDYYLANPVIETNQRFQKFTGTFAKSSSVNVLPHPYGQTQAVQMGGCMGCHGAGAQGGPFTSAEIIAGSGGTDFSFILQAVRSDPENQGVETLDDPALKQIIPDP